MRLGESWDPEGFEAWRAHYPASPFVPPAADLDLSPAFGRHWHEPRDPWPRDVAVILVAGLFSECLPQCFAGARRAFAGAGHRVLRMPVRSARGIIAQGGHIALTLKDRLQDSQRFIALAHSKGGLDLLAALDIEPSLRARCAGVALVQPPVGSSWVMDQLQGLIPRTNAARIPLADRIAAAAMRTRWLADGVRDVSRARDVHVAAVLERLPPRYPLIHAVSWSIEPTSWVDSFHARLNALRPGCAHDGQFYLEDQVLPRVPQVCVPALDHAQPVLGGRGLDVGRFWRALAALLFDLRQTR